MKTCDFCLTPVENWEDVHGQGITCFSCMRKLGWLECPNEGGAFYKPSDGKCDFCGEPDGHPNSPAKAVAEGVMG